MKKCLLALLLFLAILPVIAQDNVIKGKVTGPDGRPIEGITVTVKGTQTATKTDRDGNYIIHASGTNAHLVVSSIGYETQDLTVGTTNTAINATLKLKATQTEEVVVIGYGTVKKRDLTGSVGRVNMSDMMKAPVSSLDQALAGRVAGVQVTSTDGQPGNSINIVIRGANSVTQSNAPLYVIDGFPVEDMSINTNVNTPANSNSYTNSNNILGSINPADIESIEVLKDASATAIYGARGANGVIMITTKRGKSGPPVVKYNGFYGTQQNIRQVATLSPYEYVKYQLETNPTIAPYPGSGAPSPYQYWMSGGTTLNYYKDTAQTLDYQYAIFQKAVQMSHTMSVAGGNDKTKYSFSGNYFDQKGIIITSGYKRYQGRFSIDQIINDKAKVGLNTNYSYQDQIGTQVSGPTFNGQLNLMFNVWGFRPTNPSPASAAVLGILPFDMTQNDNEAFINTTNDYRSNPYTSLLNTFNRNLFKELMSNAYFEYKFMPSLVLRITGGVTDRNSQNQQFYNSHTWQGSNPKFSGTPNGSISNSRFTSFLNENTLTYTKNFNTVHDFSAMVGMTEQQTKVSNDGLAANKVPNEQLGINALPQGVPTTVLSGASNNTGVSFLGRVNYSYKSKYLFTASFRADGTSKFAPENRWAYFPSGAFAWRISNEKFMSKLSHVISDAKLRVSYGQTGNNKVGDFAYLSQYSQAAGSNPYVFNNVVTTGAVVQTLGNHNLKWETTSQSDLGLDLSFFRNRLSFEADVYNKVTSDLLLNANVPTSFGYTTVYKNIGKMQNQGLELALSATPIQTQAFTWTTSFNISFNRNKLIKLSDNQESLLSTIPYSGSPFYISKVGQQLGLMYGLEADGVYQYSDFDKSTAGTYVLKNEVTGNGATRANIRPGDIKYKDLNGDKTIDASDFTVIGRSLPKHIGGFSNNFTYKGFDLNIFFQWSAGNNAVNFNKAYFMTGSGGNNQFADYVNRWSPTNTNSNIPRAGGFNNGAFGAGVVPSTYLVEDGSFLRFKTLAIGYNVPASVMKHLKMKGIRVYSAMQNVMTWTKYSGQDPEVNVYNSVLTGGFDYSSYPRARTITVGLDVTF
ncbi:TonB-dependent receptor [Chitinophagaceae bacterium 26-R-25]|nr:TonB-dependent receptor [Chitinophagaceae bacterium 26-R-25]